MRISLLRFFKKIHKYLPYANFGLFYFISVIFGAKIAKKGESCHTVYKAIILLIQILARTKSAIRRGPPV